VKIILSRKGFDSGAGGVASPVLPDGAMISLPIPSKSSPIRYEDITLRGHSLGALASRLTRGKVKAHFNAHHDPDLEAAAYRRERGWRPLFGQADQAQKVLEREGVGPGDLFLFFGWFRYAEVLGEDVRFVKGAADQHVIWGWMQIDQVWPVASMEVPVWARYHPHVAAGDHLNHNTLYVAKQKLAITGIDGDLPGAGVFETHHDRLVLTSPGASRTIWDLPAWFEPRDGRPALGYHEDPGRWTRSKDRVRLQSVARGQEFVLDTTKYPEAIPWLRQLFLG
jgi:hypothetical protein